MNIRNIDLNLLHIFVVVYDCKSITLAAQQLHLTQSAVSNAITRLNNTLELKLFIKDSRSITPSRQADSLYDNIKCCLQKIESSLAQQIHFDPATSDYTFRIATTHYGELALFPKLIAHLQQHAPNIKVVRTLPPKNDDVDKELQSGIIDLALVADRKITTETHSETVCGDTMVLISGPQHPPLPDKLTLEAIIGLDLICSGYEHEPLLNALKQNPNFHPPRYTLTTMWSTFYIVSTSKLVALAPLRLVHILENYLPIKTHYLPAPLNAIKLNLYWRHVDTTDPGHAWLRALIKSILDSAE
ncbi:MAG: hypothetical protein CVV13_02255 [Gammaproteobacteria bacterium HGW-Gammaproteobacteria-3]|nr:MAG: hypothetical protein CVV13_02255 [Gammaproteobacteria bacterium HGW-Gammaproteobacteria-3]